MGAADRTIPATPRRREQAREQGLAPTATVLAWPALAALAFAVFPLWSRATMKAAVAVINAATAAGQPAISVRLWLALVLPTILLAVVAVAVFVGVRLLLDGAAWRLGRAAFRWERVSLVAGGRRLFSWTTLRRACFSAIGLAVLLGVAWQVARPLGGAFDERLPAGPAGLAVAEGTAVFAAAERFLWLMLAAAAAVAAVQWGLQRFSFERQIRMTPEEFREEMRSLQADPKIRWHQRSGSG